MPQSRLDQADARTVMVEGDVVRVAFADGEVPYLIPFGYVWMESALYGVTDPGRKTDLAERNPDVAFQLDTSARSGVFAWESVTGRGRFEIVEDRAERERVLRTLRDFAATAPEWWREEQLARASSDRVLAWRLRPTHFTGARYAPHPSAPSDR